MVAGEPNNDVIRSGRGVGIEALRPSLLWSVSSITRRFVSGIHERCNGYTYVEVGWLGPPRITRDLDTFKRYVQMRAPQAKKFSTTCYMYMYMYRIPCVGGVHT